MKKDLKIKREQNEDVEWNAKSDGTNIHVDVKDGHVILTGVVDSESKKMEAEKLAIGLEEVAEIENKITVERSDEDIKAAVIKMIEWNITFEEGHIEVIVKNSWVTLNGQVEYEYQKSKAKNLALDIKGVKGVTNHLRVIPHFEEYKKTG